MLFCDKNDPVSLLSVELVGSRGGNSAGGGGEDIQERFALVTIAEYDLDEEKNLVQRFPD